MKEHLKLLGFKVKDVVSGYIGVVVSISFDISGCVQAVVKPLVGKDGKMDDGVWIDVKRLRPLSPAPVMAVPDYEIVPGGNVLPKPSSLPMK